MIDRYFEEGDDRFLDEVLAAREAGTLKPLAERWYRDPRPFARRALLRYVDDGCDRPGHRALVKALFKLAEAEQDDEAMGHFLAAFDRLRQRSLIDGAQLREDRGLPAYDRTAKHPGRPPLDRFSRATRRYLQRRAFRYFRVLGRQDRARYGRALRAALALYEDAWLQKPERLVDAWGLMNALYGRSPVMVRAPGGVRVSPGRSLAELTPAPLYPDAWTGCRDELLDLLVAARSRPVRTWAVALLKREYAGALGGLSVGRLRALLRSPHPEVQAFSAELLQAAEGLEALPISGWLELLKLDNPLALPLICEQVARHASPDRLTLVQCVELACARPAPVAELGLQWTQKKPLRSESDLRAFLLLRDVEVPHVREAAMAWLGSLLLTANHARPEHLRELLDSRHADVRLRALEVMDQDERMREAPELWAALAESPYDDIRGYLVGHLRGRQGNLEPGTLRHVWASSLLAVHRGGRAKRAVAAQVAARIARNLDEADALLPLLAVALRSVRAPDRRAALAALARAATRAPALEQAITRALPELRFVRAEVSR